MRTDLAGYKDILPGNACLLQSIGNFALVLGYKHSTSAMISIKARYAYSCTFAADDQKFLPSLQAHLIDGSRVYVPHSNIQGSLYCVSQVLSVSLEGSQSHKWQLNPVLQLN